jgi:hypothetical protein
VRGDRSSVVRRHLSRSFCEPISQERREDDQHRHADRALDVAIRGALFLRRRRRERGRRLIARMEARARPEKSPVPGPEPDAVGDKSKSPSHAFLCPAHHADLRTDGWKTTDAPNEAREARYPLQQCAPNHAMALSRVPDRDPPQSRRLPSRSERELSLSRLPTRTPVRRENGQDGGRAVRNRSPRRASGDRSHDSAASV